MKLPLIPSLVLAASCLLAGPSRLVAAAIDTVVFGDPSSEAAHALDAPGTEVIAGALGETARRALPLDPVGIYGGTLTFTMQVDPVRRNYVSVKLWGEDDTDIRKGRFYLYVPLGGTDYQVGYRHEGDYPTFVTTGTKAPLPGRFFYNTTLLPLWMTQGKTSLTLKIVSAGRLYGLGAGGPPTGNYQYTMDRPSRGLYRAYTHVDPFLDPVGEVQGSAPVSSVRPAPGEEVMAPGGTFFNGVTNRINNRLNTAVSVTAFTTSDVEYLAKAYTVPGLVSHQSPAVLEKVVAILDAFATFYYANPTTAPSSGGNEGWGGRFGPLGLAIDILKQELTPYLEVSVDYGPGGGTKTRRAAWSDMLFASREFGRTSRDGRNLTNQTHFADNHIYKANRGLLALGAPTAFSESDAQRYIKEAAGLLPWLGSDLPTGGSSLRFGSNYFQVTDKGLTREWGYVGNAYGDLAYHEAEWYEISGNPAFRDQAAKMARARAAFRRPSMIAGDGAFYRTMEAVGLLAWRGVDEADGDYENAISYGDTTEWARGMRLAAVTGDPVLIGYAKQMLADNQYFVSLTNDSRIYGTVYALHAFADYQIVKAAPDSGIRLPMGDDQPDFAWTDEEARVLAIKHGGDRLWISPYWQAKAGTGINGVARFFYSTPHYDQIGVLETVPQFTASGSFVRPNWIDLPEKTVWNPPAPPTQAYAGEVLPLGAMPPDAIFDDPHRGKADFYAFRLGNYLMGLNAHPTKSYELKTPAGFDSAVDLVSGSTASGAIQVAPRSTVALYLPSSSDPSPIPTAPLFVDIAAAPGGLKLSWSAASGASGYRIIRATSASGPFATIADNVTETAFTDTNVAAGVTYFYRVAATNSAGESYDSMLVSAVALALPAPWGSTDIGATSGVAGYNAGNYIVTGAGSGIGAVTDSFQFTHYRAEGNATIIARLAAHNVGGANNDKIGVMIREGTDVGARFVMVMLDTATGTARVASRASTGAASFIEGPAITAPHWFKLQREGEGFTASISPDGNEWTEIGAVSVSMGSAIHIGFAVCSGDAAAPATATFDQVSVPNTIPADVSGYWKFNESSGTLAVDSSANGNNGALSAAGVTWGTGKFGRAIVLNSASSGHVTLPIGNVVKSLDDFTVSGWINVSTHANWARMFDFGSGTTRYMCLVPRTSGASVMRFAITTSGSAGEQRIDGTTALPTGGWHHVAVTISGKTGTLYLNGVAVGTNPNMTLKPSNLGATTRNYLGKSQYPDPHLNGSVDEFRIYPRALSSTEISSLANQVAPPPVVPTGVTSSAGNGKVTVSWNALAGATSYTIKRATQANGPFTTLASDITGTTFVDTTAANGSTYYYIVSAVTPDGPGEDSAVTGARPSDAVGWWRFDDAAGTTAKDHAGANNGTLVSSGAGWGSGRIDGGLTLASASAGYATLPIGSLISSLNDFTVSGWVNLTTNSTWARFFDFGSGTGKYMFVAPQTAGGGLRFAITTTGSSGEKTILSSTIPAVGTWNHIAVTLSGNTGTLYLNGTAVGTNPNINLRPSSLGITTQNYIGKAQYPDPYLNGSVDDFRIYSRALSATEIAELISAADLPPTTPPAIPVRAGATPGDAQGTVSWAASTTATSYTIKRATSPGGPFTTLVSGITGTSYIDSTAANGVMYYYTVSATNAIGTSGESVVLSTTPFDPTTVAAFSVNLRAYNSFGLAVNEPAGVVRLGYWNNVVGPTIRGEIVSTHTLTDHLGIPLPGVTATWSAGSTTVGNYTNSGTLKLGVDAGATNDANLYLCAFDQYDGTPSLLTVTGIPYANYDAIFYVYDGGATQGGTITANGQRLAIRGGLGNPDLNGTGYVRSTDATNISGSAVQRGNYVRFTGLTGDLSASFVATNVGSSTQRLKVAGFQIISNAPVPPPSAPPAAPATVTASGGFLQVGLNWALSPTATSYKIYKAGALLATLPSPSTSYADTAVVNGTSYDYTVSAVNSAGEGPRSAVVSATSVLPAFTPQPGTVYQYSVPMTPFFGAWTTDPQRRACLWVPPGCTKLQGVVMGVLNSVERPMFDDPAIRQACAEANLGLILVIHGDARYFHPTNGAVNGGALTTAIDLDPGNYKSADINPATGTNFPTDINPATGERFANQTEQAGAEVAALLKRLAIESGYSELENAPLLLVGHSAASPFVWTRGLHATAALNGRVFGLLPFKGFFPGGIPAGMPVMHVGCEWQELSNWGNMWEMGDAPAERNLRAAGEDRLLSTFTQAGTGHFAYSEEQSGPLALFIKKAAQVRIPANWAPDTMPTLRTINPQSGVLVDVTKMGSGNAQPVAYADWVGGGKDPRRAFWYIDQELAQAVCDTQNANFSKRPQVISAYINATTPASLGSQTNGSGVVTVAPVLEADGINFKVRGLSLNHSPVPRLHHGAPVGISTGVIRFSSATTGLRQTGPDTFRVWIERGPLVRQGQPWGPSLLLQHSGDSEFRSADRPLGFTSGVAVNNLSGAAQTITFPDVPDQNAGNLQPIQLNAIATSGLPVQYWMVSGPYRTDAHDSSRLIPWDFPAKPNYPIRVIVGAYQWGKPGTFAGAPVVFKEFFIQPPPPVVTSATTASGTYGAPFNYVIAATNSPTGFSATGLPAGLTLDPATGVISGMLAAAGDFTVTLGATNAGGTGNATLTFSVAKASASVALSNLATIYDGTTKTPTATTNPSGLTVTFTYDGTATAPTAAGTFNVLATIADANYAGTASGVLTIAPAPATITLGNLTQTYNGSPKAATATSSPANVPVSVTYDSSTAAPVAAGSYAVAATVTDPNYSGSAAGTLTIAKATAGVFLDNLAQIYSGMPRPVTVTTDPAGLPVSITYNGNSTAPEAAGSYSVVAAVNSPNYTGSASGTLVVAKAAATLSLAPLMQAYDGTPKAVTATTTPSGLNVTLTYNGAVEAPVYPGEHNVVATIDDANYSGSQSDTLVITTTALVRHAPTLDGIVDGSVQVLLPESVTLNSAASVSGDLLVPGTPAVNLNGSPAYVGTIDGPGEATPTNHIITLDGGAVLRYVVRRIDAGAMPVVTAPPAPAGTRDVDLNNASQPIGDLATLRNLTLNSGAGTCTLGAGTYGRITLNGGMLVLGTAGASEVAIYNLQALTLNGGSQLQIVGPTVITLAGGATFNSSVVAGGHPEWLTLKIASGGLTLNGAASLEGHVVAPSGTVIINSATVRGTLAADRLILNGNSLLDQTTP